MHKKTFVCHERPEIVLNLMAIKKTKTTNFCVSQHTRYTMVAGTQRPETACKQTKIDQREHVELKQVSKQKSVAVEKPQIELFLQNIGGTGQLIVADVPK